MHYYTGHQRVHGILLDFVSLFLSYLQVRDKKSDTSRGFDLLPDLLRLGSNTTINTVINNELNQTHLNFKSRRKPEIPEEEKTVRASMDLEETICIIYSPVTGIEPRPICARRGD